MRIDDAIKALLRRTEAPRRASGLISTCERGGVTKDDDKGSGANYCEEERTDPPP